MKHLHTLGAGIPMHLLLQTLRPPHASFCPSPFSSPNMLGQSFCSSSSQQISVAGPTHSPVWLCPSPFQSLQLLQDRGGNPGPHPITLLCPHILCCQTVTSPCSAARSVSRGTPDGEPFLMYFSSQEDSRVDPSGNPQSQCPGLTCSHGSVLWAWAEKEPRVSGTFKSSA